ncbi:MAG TPA: hypothetical protein VJN70_02000 [Gemmatimonadaceae bacterium]|nr:hypothetical protein [Gemmatimonadaceae bacterium]
MRNSGQRSTSYTPAEDASAARLVRAFDESVRGSTAVNGELTAAVCAYVGELQRQQLLPERVLIALKHVLSHVDAYPMNHPDPDSLLQRVISLAINEYYRLEVAGSRGPRARDGSRDDLAAQERGIA